jgi:hypothetical protein
MSTTTSSTAAGRMTDLADAELYTSDALHEFTGRVRNLCRDLSWVLEFQADTLQANLATLPVVDSRFGSLSSRARARAVAWCLRSAADAVKHAGKLSVKCWSLFLKYYVRDTAPVPTKPAFKITQK